MINRILDIVFVDSFAFAINVTLGTVLKSKICNYSWDKEITPFDLIVETIDSDSVVTEA